MSKHIVTELPPYIMERIEARTAACVEFCADYSLPDGVTLKDVLLVAGQAEHILALSLSAGLDATQYRDAQKRLAKLQACLAKFTESETGQ